MTDWDLMTPGIGLTSIGIVGVGISLSGIAKTFIDGMHAVSLLTMFIGMIFLASGLFKDGFPTSGRAKSATFITLGFLVTFGAAAAVTVSTQVPSIYAYIGLMLIISIPATVIAVASYRGVQYLKPLAIIFVGAAIVGGSTFYAFGLVTPKPPVPAEEGQGGTANQTAGNATAAGNATTSAPPPGNTIGAKILPGASAEGNPSYDPNPILANQGDGIVWINEDNTPHTVTSKEEGVFDSGIINPTSKYLLNTVDLQLAEYDYYCTLHPFMLGKLVLAGGGGAANQTAGNATAAGNATGSSPEALVTGVTIVNGASVPTNDRFYVPNTIETNVGSMITWKNDDTTPHTVTSGTVENNSPKPDGRFDSGIINAGNSFPFVFDQAGEYPYYCTIHPWMNGKVNVN